MRVAPKLEIAARLSCLSRVEWTRHSLAVGYERSTEMATTASQRQFLALKLDALTESEVHEVLDYIAIMESMRRSRTVPSIWEDEVVAVLADARENQRARQAFEWEAVRRKAERRAIAKPIVHN
jgi:signal transduction histidine kinase